MYQKGEKFMSVRFFVLGVLYGKDAHGYKIKETARLWALPRWADIQEGSIYHARREDA